MTLFRVSECRARVETSYEGMSDVRGRLHPPGSPGGSFCQGGRPALRSLEQRSPPRDDAEAHWATGPIGLNPKRSQMAAYSRPSKSSGRCVRP
jgi:hypothetical protein